MTSHIEASMPEELQNELHDLRTPLNQIIGFTEMLLEIITEDGRLDLKEGLDAVREAGIELTTLLGDAGIIALRGEEDELHWPLIDAVRAPVSRVLGFADLILSEPPESSLSDYTSDVGKIRSAASQFLNKARISKIVIQVEAARDWVQNNGYRSPASNATKDAGRVLIVDDENLNREILCRRLRREGYSSVGVESGHAALDILASETFDIVLLDIMMPGIGGIEVLQSLKQSDRLRHLPVLMLSALTDVDRVARCIELGAEDYLPKPVNAVLLRARLGACLEKKRLRDHEQAAMRALDAEKDLLTVTLQSLADAVVTTDAEGRIVLFNSVAASMTQIPLDEVRGQSLASLFPILDRNSGQPVPDAAHEALRTGIACDSLPGATLATPFGERLVAVRSAPIHTAEGDIRGTVVVLRDVTEKEKIAGEVLRTSKLESIGVLAGGLAHDFNNMLTAVIGNLSLLRHTIEQSPEILQRLNEAEGGALRARDLAQYLLTFAEGGAPVKKNIDTSALLHETTEFVTRGSRTDCDFDIPENLWKIEADPGQITQAISSIVMNAEQAMPEGGTIFIKAENVKIEAEPGAPLPSGAYLSISISDTGVGILPEHLPRVFDPFFTTRNQARGLGLAAAYSIINRHGGNIELESSPGFGTKVGVLLPASHVIEDLPPPEPEAAPVLEHGVRDRRYRVLVMDDEPSIRMVSESMLDMLEFEVVSTADGSEALHAYAEAKKNGNPFDLIITDLTVPGGMGGAETVRRLRESGSTVKAIVSSGYSNGPVMSNPAEYGFNAVLPKPYRLHDLEAVLQKLNFPTAVCTIP